MKDVTSTSFGLLIAYLLPGLVGLYALSFCSPPLRESLGLIVTAQANAGLLVLMVLASLTLGLLVHGVRFFLFERPFRKTRKRADESEFLELASKDKLEAFRAAVDEMYRYHQWWGGICIVAPFVCLGWLWTYWAALSYLLRTVSVAAAISFELLFIYIASFVLKQYLERRRAILKGET